MPLTVIAEIGSRVGIPGFISLRTIGGIDAGTARNHGDLGAGLVVVVRVIIRAVAAVIVWVVGVGRERTAHQRSGGHCAGEEATVTIVSAMPIAAMPIAAVPGGAVAGEGSASADIRRSCRDTRCWRAARKARCGPAGTSGNACAYSRATAHARTATHMHATAASHPRAAASHMRAAAAHMRAAAAMSAAP